MVNKFQDILVKKYCLDILVSLCEEQVINMFSKLENRYFLIMHLVFRTSYLIDNPFNENLVGKEDRYWASDVVENGYSYVYEPKLICHHHYTANVIL